MNILNKIQLIREAFHQYDLKPKQERAIEQILVGYIDLIQTSLGRLPSPNEIKVFVDLIKSNLVNTLNILKYNER